MYHEVGKINWLLLNIFLKCIQPLTDVLQNLNQQQLSALLRTIYNIPKRATSLIYRMVWFTFSGAPNDIGQIWLPVQKKAQKSVNIWNRNTTLAIYTSLMQCKFATVLSIIYFNYFFGNWTWNFGIRVWKKAWSDTPMQSEQSIEIFSLYVQTKYKF